MAGITYLDKAIAINKNVSMLLQNRMDDEYFLSLSCFNIQQAHEMLLKYILEFFNIKYKKTHDIGYLINTLETKIPLYCIELKNIADTLTEWEASSRYTSDFLGTVKEVYEAQRIFNLMLNELEYNFYNINSEDYIQCYNFIKANGYKYEEDIIQCLENIVNKTIERPFQQNVYTLINNNLRSYFNNNDSSNQTNLFN